MNLFPNQTNELELKPCPFCGDSRHVYLKKKHKTYIGCNHCDIHIFKWTHEEVVRLWNMRGGE